MGVMARPILYKYLLQSVPELNDNWKRIDSTLGTEWYQSSVSNSVTISISTANTKKNSSGKKGRRTYNFAWSMAKIHKKKDMTKYGTKKEK